MCALNLGSVPPKGNEIPYTVFHINENRTQLYVCLHLGQETEKYV